MPKSKRDVLKRHLSHARRDIRFAIDHIAQVAIVFEPVHPELEAGLKIAAELCGNAITMLETFALAAWQHELLEDEPWHEERIEGQVDESDERLVD